MSAPLLAVSDLSEASAEDAAQLQQRLEDTEGVAVVTKPLPGESGSVSLIRVLPTTGPQEQETRDLVDTIRADVLAPFDAETGANSHLGGEAAITDDFDTYISSKLPLFMGVVIALSALLLLVAFRSILVPLKAVVPFTAFQGAAVQFCSDSVEPTETFVAATSATLILVKRRRPKALAVPELTLVIVMGVLASATTSPKGNVDALMEKTL